MLTAAQTDELERRGVVRLPGLVGPDVAAGVADAVWALLARRGIDRHDPAGWPAGRLSGLQALRQARVYAPFADPAHALADHLLGPGAWVDMGQPQALVTFPEPGPWAVPDRMWHLDVPARGDPDRPAAVRTIGLVEAVAARGGATVVVEGSHELARRLVRASATRDAGSSARFRRRLRRHPWFRTLFGDGDGADRARLMGPADVDGVTVRVTELTGAGGDIWLLHPWLLHGLAPNAGSRIRSMCTHTVLAAAPGAGVSPPGSRPPTGTAARG